ncbi:hypothetical protein [Streptomyces sp. NPDC054865]
MTEPEHAAQGGEDAHADVSREVRARPRRAQVTAMPHDHVLPFTCGSRAAVLSTMWRSIHDAVPGEPGTVRASVICELAEHPPAAPHGGVVLELGDGRGAVWASWSDGSAPKIFTARDDCPTAGLQACVLFAGHPGLCSPHINPRYRADTDRLPRVRTALDTLKDPGGDRLARQAASGTAALGIWDELISSDRWTAMAECDQAALYRRLAGTGSHLSTTPEHVNEMVDGLSGLAGLCESPPGTVLAGGIEAAELTARLWALPKDWQTAVLGGQHQPSTPLPSYCRSEQEVSAPRPALDSAIAHAEQLAARGEGPPRLDADWPSWSRERFAFEDLRKRGTESRKRLGRLPYGWQVDAVRRIRGGVEAVSAASVGCDMNVLRIHGLYLGSWAGHEPCRPRRSPC